MENADALQTRVPDERLESWKEIGSYLNRDVRTVERWERTRGMPVHRLPGGEKARVYALKPELDAWRSSRDANLRETDATSSVLASIAVLPFANLSDDKENEYFSDGLAEDIINALATLPGLRVVARTSAFAFRGKNATAAEIGARLKVTTILEGSVRKSGNRFRVTAQLIRTSDQSHLWQERYDREMTDLFAIQDEISHAIVEKLRVRLIGDEPLVKPYTENLEAYSLFLRGRHCIHKVTPESLAKGKEYLDQAIALDADNALAYSALAEYYWANLMWDCTMPGSEAIPQAKAAALTAVQLDDTLAEAHAQLGSAKGIGDFDWVGAEREFRRALELNPASAIVHYYYGLNCLRPMGRLEEELAIAQRAVELDPLSPRYSSCLGYIYSLAGEFNPAIEQCRRAMDLAPDMYQPHFMIAATYQHADRIEESVAEYKKSYELSGRNVRVAGALAYACGLARRQGEVRALLKQLIIQCRKTYVPAFAMLSAYLGTGEFDQAFEWLEKAVDERDLMVVCHLKLEPSWSIFRRNPRYQALLRKMNLEL